MKRKWIGLLACMWMLLACAGLRAEQVADLPEPTSYVNDFAHVVTAEDAQKIEDLNRALHDQANARVVVVTINTLDFTGKDGQGGTQTKEEFAAALEEKWKLGKKGEDRSAILLFVKSPPKRWIEIGYGLEGDLNDAKVGAILDAANDPEQAGNFSQAIVIEDQGLADVIAKAANVVLAPPTHTYHEQAVPAEPLTAGQRVMGGGVLLVILLVVYVLYKTGNLGLLFLLLNMFSGSGGGGGGGGGSDDSFGEGGGSGGGGAGRDF